MLLSVVVSLYTSRVVLEVLGVEDYGLYGLVGGVVSMFSFLNSTMAGATSRFLTFEMGKGNQERIRATFSSALIIHIGIALIVLLLAETVGLWFLNNKLVIPAERMTAAHWVFQVSVLGMMVTFTQVPYNAAIIAHEKMDIYAYVELLNVFLKLGIVYLLSIGNIDKLILYAFLVLLVNVLIAFIYRLFCIKNYNETRVWFIFEKNIIKPMISFSSWELISHLGYTFRMQGINVVLNMFFGVVINAVVNIATTIQSTLLNFSNNIVLAFKPQIIKNYAIGQFSEMTRLVMSGTKLNILLQAIFTIPIIFNIDYILNTWLKNPPGGASAFCCIMLCSNLLASMTQLLNTAIQATGKVKVFSLSQSIIYIIVPIFTYFYFSCTDSDPIFAYIIIFISQILSAIITVVILKSLIKSFEVKNYVFLTLKLLVVFFIVCILNESILHREFHSLQQFIFILTLDSMVILSSFYFCIFNSNERSIVSSFIKKILSSLKKTNY